MAKVERQLRIGELSRRVGLTPELLRAWEHRYHGLLQPERTTGGLRLYSPADERRIRAMQERRAEGVSPAEAARLVIAGDEGGGAAGTPPLEGDANRLRDALDDFDADAANAVLDRLFASVLLDTVLADVVLPYLRKLGERWDDGTATVAQEHFASNLIRSRLAALARGWERGSGPLALLACAPGELHDLPLLILGLALRARGWRIAYLGADTPADSLSGAAERLEPALVVVSAMTRSRFRRAAKELTALAQRTRLALAGPGASGSLAEELGAELLGEGPVAVADRIAA